MEDIKSQGHHDEIQEKKINEETLEIKNKQSDSVSNSELNKNNDAKINNIDTGNNNSAKDKTLEDYKKLELNPKLNSNKNKSNNIEKSNQEIIKENITEDQKLDLEEHNSNSAAYKSTENDDKPNKEIAKEENKKVISEVKSNVNTEKNNIEKSNQEIIKENITEDKKLDLEEHNSNSAAYKSTENDDKPNKEIAKEENKKVISEVKSTVNTEKNTPKVISDTIPVKAKTKPVKEPPIEKKPFLEFVNNYLIPEINNEFKLKGKEVTKINLQKTNRPIAGDTCWVIYCEIKDTCNFWLSFEKDDITSLKSFSLCKNYEKPSIIESFLIDEKKITLKLIISRILQRLNGQKLIGAN